MAKISKADIQRTNEARKRIAFYGTPEKGYLDSGLWEYLDYVYTKDAHDQKQPVKKLLGDDAEYIVVAFLHMLACPVLAMPKSRQIRMSWISCAFATWFARTAPYRHIVYQTKKEEDAHAQVTQGAKNPADGRMDFIEQHLPLWLQDENITSGRGNQVGVLTYSHNKIDRYGCEVPWYGSKINAIPQGAHQIRQYTPSLILSDESAFQEEYGPSMVAAKPAVTGGGRIISVSSVDNGSAFNQMVLESASGTPDWHTREGADGIVSRAMQAVGMEWPKGLRTRHTPSGTRVLEIHYSADKKKDPERAGDAWINEAVKGYVGGFDSVGWRTEMEIDYGAGGGEPVFPFLQPGSPIYCDAIHVSEAKRRFRFYAGLDYGTVNPAHFGVWGVETGKDGRARAYKVYEVHEPCVDLDKYIEKMKRCPYWDEIEYIVCDWSLMNKTQRNRDGKLVTISEQFFERGVNLIRGTRGADVPHVLRLKSTFWSDPENPTMYITKACPMTWKEYMGLRWAEHASVAVEQRRNKKEEIRDKDNHSFDADSYLWDTEPSGVIVKAEAVPGPGTFGYAARQISRQARADRRRRSGVGAL